MKWRADLNRSSRTRPMRADLNEHPTGLLVVPARSDDSERSERRAPAIPIEGGANVTRGSDSPGALSRTDVSAAGAFGLSSGIAVHVEPEVSATLGNTTRNLSNVAAQRLRERAKRSDRWALQELLWKVSTLERISGCRRRRLAKDTDPAVLTDPKTGLAHFVGVQLCGSIWACAVCGPKIRQRRAEEINTALLALINVPTHWGEGKPRERSCPVAEKERALVGTPLLLTLTMPHDFGEKLGDLLATIRDGHHGIVNGRQWVEDQKAFRIVGYIRAHDSTDGQNGWHPHLHSVLCIGGTLTPTELTRLKRRLYVRWSRALVGERVRAGERSESYEARLPSYRNGIDLEQARSVEDVARYAATVAGDVDEAPTPKRHSVQVGAHGRVGLELTRNDLKTGLQTRAGKQVSRTPWEILRAIRLAPKCDEWGEVNEARENDLRRWHEWEQETRGKQAMRWSKGLKTLLGVTTRTDEEIVKEKIGGELQHQFSTVEWWAMCGTRGACAQVLERAETAGGDGVREFLSRIVPAWMERRAKEREWERQNRALMYPLLIRSLPDAHLLRAV